MEKEKDGFWRSLGRSEFVVIALGLVVVIGVAAILSPGIRGFFAHSATAAWVQAIGSIGAIGVAVLVSSKQAKSQRELRASELEWEKTQASNAWKNELEGACQIIERLGQDLRQVCSAAIAAPKDGFTTPYRRARYLKSARDAAGRVELYRMPFAVIARPATVILHQASVCIELLDSMSPGGPGDPVALASPRTPEERFREIKGTTRIALEDIDIAVRGFDGYSPPVSARKI